jgi:hypothetical protein
MWSQGRVGLVTMTRDWCQGLCSRWPMWPSLLSTVLPGLVGLVIGRV